MVEKDPLIYIENKISDHDKNKIKDIVNKRIEETVNNVNKMNFSSLSS